MGGIDQCLRGGVAIHEAQIYITQQKKTEKNSRSRGVGLLSLNWVVFTYPLGWEWEKSLATDVNPASIFKLNYWPKFHYDCYTDMDECLEGLSTCLSHQRCLNTIGSFQCLTQSMSTSTVVSPSIERCPAGLAWNRETRRCEGEIYSKRRGTH